MKPGIFLEVLVLVEHPQVKEETEQREGPRCRMPGISHRLTGHRQRLGEELVGRVVAHDEQHMAEEREALPEVCPDATWIRVGAFHGMRCGAHASRPCCTSARNRA